MIEKYRDLPGSRNASSQKQVEQAIQLSHTAIVQEIIRQQLTNVM